MLGISLPELGVILVIALLFIGPKELPSVVRTVRTLKKQFTGLKRECAATYEDILKAMPMEELKEEVEKVNHQLQHITDLEGRERPAYNVDEVVADLNRIKEIRKEAVASSLVNGQ